MQIPIFMTWKQAIAVAIGAFVLAWIVKFAAAIAFNLLLIISVVGIIYAIYLLIGDYIGHLFDDHISGSDD